MSYDEFFTDGDKPYAENLNDSIVLLDAFDVTVPCEMPTMFSNGDFSSNVNVTRKCGVALVTLKSVDSGVTIGTDEISGTGEVIFRIYPNFNSFYKWSKIILEKSGTVGISFKKADGTNISANVGADGTISDAAALKILEEIDVIFTLDDATISNILIWFINNQNNRNRTNALLEADQLVNVNGTVTSGDTKAVSGDTVKNAFDSFETDVVDLKEDTSNKVSVLDSNNAHYPSCSAVTNGLNTKANATHPHNIQDIVDLYDITLTASKYNVNMGSTVDITVKVTNRATGQSVEGVTVPVVWHGHSSTSGTTGSDGTFTLTYAPSTFGLQMFSAGTSNIQINVKGYIKQELTSGAVNIYYNDHEVNVVLNHTQNVLSCTDQEWRDLAVDEIRSELLPKIHQYSATVDTKVKTRINGSTGKLQYQSSTYLTDKLIQCNFCYFIVPNP